MTKKKTTNNQNCKIKNKIIKKPNLWSEEEDKILLKKVEEFNYKNWNIIASFIKGRTAIQCSARYKRIKPGIKKGYWNKEEDNKLKELFEIYGKNWSKISKLMPERTGKQIRDRFLNSLDENVNKNQFSKEEDLKIISLYKIYGNCWVKIAKKLNGRTGDMVKNRFYSSLKKIINNEKGKNKKNHLLKKKRMRCYENKFKIKKDNIFNDKINNSNNKNDEINNLNIIVKNEEEEKNSNDDNKKDNENITFKKQSVFTPLKYIPQYENINNNINNNIYTIFNLPFNSFGLPIMNNTINFNFKTFFLNQFNNNNCYLNRISIPTILINKCDLNNNKN